MPLRRTIELQAYESALPLADNVDGAPHEFDKELEVGQAYLRSFHLAVLENPRSFGTGFRSLCRERVLNRFFDDDIHTIGFTFEGVIVGALSVHHNQRSATEFGYLFRLGVARSQRLGAKLLHAGIFHAAEQDSHHCELSVLGNNPARDLYEAIGFVSPEPRPQHRGPGKPTTMTLAQSDFTSALAYLEEITQQAQQYRIMEAS